MWQVVTASPRSQSDGFICKETPILPTELDDLITALSEWKPITFPTRLPSARATGTRSNSSHHVPKVKQFKSQTESAIYLKNNGAVLKERVVSTLEIPHSTSKLDASTMPPELREQLLKLRTTILLAAEQENLRSVLLCEADENGTASELAVYLSQMLAEYARLKIAYISVGEDRGGNVPGRKRLPMGYTFQIRNTNQPNRYEIASSLGVVRLEDWLQWWKPSVVLREMQKVFDVVVISTPPISTHPDVALLAGAVDGVILIATQNVTPYAQLEQATQALQQAQAKILGVTLRQPPPTTSIVSAVVSRIRAMFERLAERK